MQAKVWGSVLSHDKARVSGTFSISLKESEETSGREVPCIIELDKREESFVLEALPLEMTELSTDEVQLLYLQKSIQMETLP